MVNDTLIDRVLELLDSDTGFIGVSTGTIPVVQSDTLLPNEVSRKTTTNIIASDTLISDVYFDETELNDINITSVATFCNGGTSTVNTGEIAVADNVNIIKNNTQSLTISIELTVERNG